VSNIPTHVREYWLGWDLNDAAAADQCWQLWYRGGSVVDEEIRERFGSAVEGALAQDETIWEWASDPNDACALVILLDQFTRNLYRSTPQAYAGDSLALALAKSVVDRGADRALSVLERVFLYHPFHHGESVAAQESALRMFEILCDDAPEPWNAHLARHLRTVQGHRNTVIRFGRFPHRNAVLGRQSTEEEIAYLAEQPNTFGQTAKT
jgi:uncharacterized protein (DUF924 family)